MLKLAFDENFNNNVRAWAASDGRVLFTHDAATMAAFAAERTQAGLPMPGLFEAPTSIAKRTAIDDIILIAECSLEGEWEGQIIYLPLR